MAESPIISCCVPAEVKSRVEQLAARRRWTRSQTTAWLIEMALNELDRRLEEARLVETPVKDV
jgi:predicted transcriptional regulator